MPVNRPGESGAIQTGAAPPIPIACAAFQMMDDVLRHVTVRAELFREVNGRHAERAIAGTRCASGLSPRSPARQQNRRVQTVPISRTVDRAGQTDPQLMTEQTACGVVRTADRDIRSRWLPLG
jgi:hypothetical protein